MVCAGRTGWRDVTEPDDKGRDSGPDGPATKKKKLFDLATVRGWIEAGGALVGVVGAAVGIYLQIAPVKKPSSPKPAAQAVPSVTQSGTGNVYGDGNTVTIDITGYTIEQHEARLRQQEETLTAQFETASAAGSGRQDELTRALSAVQAQLENVSASYQERLTELKRRAVELEQAGGEMDASVARQAASALNDGDVEKAGEIIAQARGEIREAEPNNDLLSPQAIALDRPVGGSIALDRDEDVFSFRTPETYRDWIHVRLAAKSATLRPQMVLYAGDKTETGSTDSNTPGADLNYYFVSEPAALHYVRVEAYSRSQGAYELTVTPLKSHDSYEPNDGLTQAREIAAGTQISAEIMDRDDVDVYAFTCKLRNSSVAMKLLNESDRLWPQVAAYDENRKQTKDLNAENAGSNILWNMEVRPQQAYYISVSAYSASRGKYTLSIGDC